MSNPETFDHIYGLSQSAANDYLRELFRVQPDLSQLSYTDANTKARMTGTLDAPTVVFGLDEETKELKIYFETRFASGSIYFSETTSQDLTGWIITAWANLVNPTVTSKAGDGEYSILSPGDYSIRRLLSAFSAQGWTAPDYDASFYRKPDGTTATLMAWSKDSKNSKIATPVKNVLRRWAIAHQDNPFFSIQPKEFLGDIPLDPTSVPTALHLQFAKYSGPATGVMSTEQSPKLFDCFLFCEKSNNDPLPKEKKLSLTDELAGPAAGARAKLNGTSIFNHGDFLTKHLLPTLEGLCAMSRLVPLRPKSFVDSSQQYVLQPSFFLGGDPIDPELSAQLQASAGFGFSYSKEGEYAWDRTFAAPGSQSDVFAYNGEYAGQLFRRYRIESQSKATVTWEPGSDFLKFASVIKYYHWDGWRKKDSNFSCERNNESLSQVFENKISWSVNIRLLTSHTKPDIPNGMIVPEIDGVSINNGLPIDFNATPNDSTVDVITSTITSTLKENLEQFSAWLRKAGAFVYPGANQLAFGPIHLDNSGDMKTSCDWQQPKNDTIAIYPPKQPLEPFKFPDATKIMAPLPVKRHFPLLTWNVMNAKLNTDTGEAKFIVFPYSETELGDRLFTSLKIRVGLPGSHTFLKDATFEDSPQEYDTAEAHVVSSIDQDGTIRASLLPTSGHDSFIVPSGDVAYLIEPRGTLMGSGPYVVRVDEGWDRKDGNGNQLGHYATQHFHASLVPNPGTHSHREYAKEVPWLDAEDMIHVE